MARLFIGIPLPGDYHDRCAALIRDLRELVRSRVRWTPYGNAHITLLFLDEVDDGDISRVKECLATVSGPAFQVRAAKCGAFPNAKRPRVIFAGITKGAKPCADLARAVTEAMAPFGVQPDDRPFAPHITLGRVKELARDDWPKVLRDTTFNWPGVQVDNFTLWRSDITDEGAIYTPVAEFPLSGK